MPLDDYTDLQASIGNWLDRADLVAVIPDFISMTEAQIMRRLMKDGPVADMLGRSDATVTTEYVTVPSDFLGVRAITLNTPYGYPLQFVEPEKIDQQKQLYTNATGDPSLFSIVGNQFQFWPWAGNTYSAEIAYWKSVTPLSSTNATNWLLTKHPDVYLYGSLSQSAPYLKDDDRLQMWSTMYQTILSDIVESDKLYRQTTQMAATLIPGGVSDGMRNYGYYW